MQNQTFPSKTLFFKINNVEKLTTRYAEPELKIFVDRSDQ